MSFEFPNKPAFTATPHERRFALDEFDGVSLLVDAVTSDGEAVPAGAIGTVVGVWGRAEAYKIEFDEPYTGLVRATPDMLERLEPEAA